jgi:FAD/FMN-containing dehydrogenase
MTAISRRSMMKGLAAAPLAVVGWSAIAQRWVAAADSTCPPFDQLPALKGQVVLDSASLRADSTDFGSIVTATPCAVLRPADAADVAAMVAYCAARKIRVAARGAAHTTYGQSLNAQLTIEMRHLNTIYSIAGGVAELDAGALWSELLPAAVNAGWRPAGGPPDYMGLTIGGHAAVGGINPLSFKMRGAVDHILAAEVVTGAGQKVYCSPTEQSDLFAATLAGLGQCGIMTRAWVEMVSAPARCRTYTLVYTSISAFFADCRLLADRGQVSGLYGLWTPPGTAVLPQLIVDMYYTGTAPDDATVLAGTTGVATSIDRTYLERVMFYDTLLNTQKTVGWGNSVKPWFDVFVPDAAAESYVGGLFGSLTTSDI